MNPTVLIAIAMTISIIMYRLVVKRRRLKSDSNAMNILAFNILSVIEC